MHREVPRDLKMYKVTDRLTNITMDNFKEERAEAMKEKRYEQKDEWATLRASFSSSKPTLGKMFRTTDSNWTKDSARGVRGRS